MLAIAVAFLVRLGLEEGFARYELAVLAGVFVLLASFLFLGEPVGLAATVLVAGLILRRAGRWWRAPAASSGLAVAHV
ncbi:hypothetical protein [Bradyrhizobium sp.]|uniref:hypothetical protein n=1 Tax=Bradyrhizobium sp. TaxID=376 RepID=UPI00345B9BDF